MRAMSERRERLDLIEEFSAVQKQVLRAREALDSLQLSVEEERVRFEKETF